MRTTPQTTTQTGRFPTKWNCSRPTMTAMPDDRCILATAQMWQPRCLGAKEGFHCLLEDAVALILVICSRSQEIRCRPELWQIEVRAMHLLQGPWVLSDKPFPAPGLCSHQCRRHWLVTSLLPIISPEFYIWLAQ